MAGAMILAAGRGERMRPLSDATPKALLAAGGKPLIAWQIEALARAGFRDIVINAAWLAPQLTAAPPDEASKLDLTGRQTAVLRLLVKGLANQEIAKKLDISENTVKQHTHALYGALKVSSRTQAIVAAARLGIKSD